MFDDWKEIHLPNIFPTEIKKSIHYDIKVRPFEYLKGMLYMSSVLEKQENKLFQPLPLRNNIIPKHIILDTASIINLFCPEKDKDGNKTKKGELLNNVKENQNEIWCNFFDMKNKIFKNKYYQFHNQIQTDGISCCLLFIRKDLKDKKWGSKVPVLQEQDFHTIEDLTKEQLDTLKDRNVVGCDPGKHSLVYMMDKNGNKLEYTASQRKIESYGKRNHQILLQEKKKHKIIEKETRLSTQNSKSVDYEKFNNKKPTNQKKRKYTIRKHYITKKTQKINNKKYKGNIKLRKTKKKIKNKHLFSKKNKK